MKKNIFKNLIMISLVGGALFTACTDLEEKFEDAIERDEIVKGGSVDPAAALTAVYTHLDDKIQTQDNFYALTEHPSDEMMGPTRGTDWSDFGVLRQLHSHNWDASHSWILNSWNDLNKGVFLATEAIDLLKDDKPKVAEARFMRAFFMFYIVDLFGQVPFRNVTDGLDVNPVVKSRSEATDFIISEVNAAMPDLKSVSEAGIGKASKEAANALLAKVYLNRAVFTSPDPAAGFSFKNEDMQAVIDNCDAVINSGLFALEPVGEYWDNFVADNANLSKELIFTIPNKRGDGVAGNVRNRYYMTLHYNNNPAGWNGFTTVADFYSKWTDNSDQRKSASLPGVTDVSGLKVGFLEGQQKNEKGEDLKDRSGAPLSFTPNVDLFYATEVQGVRVIKYPPDYANLNVPENDYVLFRLADVVLMKAEALHRKGDSGAALTLVNDLRQKRGVAALNGLTDDALLDERGFELYWEGWRRNDQIRFGKFLQAWSFKPASNPRSVLFPIPQTALDTNPNLSQNPGY